MKGKKILISCGGTGGHIFPAIEIAKSLKKKNKDIDILFVGAYNKMEMIKVPQEGFSIIGLWIQGFYRKSIFKNLLFPVKLIISLIHSIFILLYYRPIAVIGTGGFASGPLLFVSSLFGITTYIQEQNCVPGITNRILSKKVFKIFVAHNMMEHVFPKNKIINFGNPVRNSLMLKQDLHTINKSKYFFGLSPNIFTILIVGGSLGAEPINKAVYQNLKNIISNDIQIIWQTGVNDYHNYSSCQSKFCSVKKFIDRMDFAYSASDIVISRAGAIAISEISYLSKASILIPSPHVTDDHQTENASYLAKNNACIVIHEDELIDNLTQAIQKIRNQNF